jgi:uncharacterized membrane protein YedE/YeeE
MQTSTVLAALGGGALIGASASLILLAYGGVAGISNIVASLIRPGGANSWRLGFIVGLVAAGLFAAVAYPGAVGTTPVSLPLVAIGGLLVGIGSRVGNGCTSGHGVCGIARFSQRSIAATITFMAVAIVTVAVVRLLGGWS